MKSLLTKLAQLKLKAIKTPWVHFVHTGIAFVAVLLAHLFGLNKWLAGVIMLLVAGAIEFWFDKHYELQSFEDNYSDFKDYLIGVLILWLM